MKKLVIPDSELQAGDWDPVPEFATVFLDAETEEAMRSMSFPANMSCATFLVFGEFNVVNHLVLEQAYLDLYEGQRVYVRFQPKYSSMIESVKDYPLNDFEEA